MTTATQAEHIESIYLAADFLRIVGMPVASDYMRAIAAGSCTEFLTNAIEAGLAEERERMERDYAIELAVARLMMKAEYEMALSMKGNRIPARNSQDS